LKLPKLLLSDDLPGLIRIVTQIGDDHSDVVECDARAPIRARRVGTHGEANEIANVLTRAIATFIPSEDREGVLAMDPGLTRYRSVEQPLGYLMSELLENALTHARAGGFSHASVTWGS
jgi:hypothetical protein